MNEIRDWLERLYGHSPGHFAITAFAGGRPRRTVWYETSRIDAAVKTITRNALKADIYVSVSTHDSPQPKRGGESSVVSIPGFWADLDIGEEGHKPASLPNPPDEATALSIVDGLPEPSMLMHSGGGLQAFWLFDSPWVFADSVDKASAKQASMEWHNLLEERARTRGFHVDKVANLDRILRIPGTYNHKTGTPRPVTVRWSDKPIVVRERLTALGIPDQHAPPAPSSTKDADDFPMSWDEILAPHGYTKCNDTSWVRPGKACSEGISLSVWEQSPYVITNFSGSDDRLPVGPGTKLTKSKVYALLNKVDEEKAKKVLSKRKLTLTPASDITPKPVHWLWQARVAMGTLALLAGREGIGKSTLAYTLVADITKGKLDGVYFGEPHSVIVVATEDSWEFTIVPRLMAAGADLSKVYRVESADQDEYGISLPRDIEELSVITKESGTALILLDPLMSRVDAKLDTHKDSEVRQALEPLVRMANDGGAAVLGLIHVNKGGSTDPLTSIMGSRAFSAVSRAVLFVAEDPEDSTIKVMCQAKNNLGRGDLPELSYTLDEVTVGEWEGEPITSAILHWGHEQKPGTLQGFLNHKARSKGDDAALWLETFLKINGKTPAKEAKEAGEKEGYGAKMLERARDKIGVKHRGEGFPAVVYWELPGSNLLFEEQE